MSDQLVSKDNIAKFVTVGIKTFHRPKCLSYCIDSIRSVHNDIIILVADDSDQEMKATNRKITELYSNVTLLDLPFNSGLSYGRNRLVDETMTPYFLNLDDDNYISNETNIVNSASFLQSNDSYGLIAGICPNRGILYNEMSISYSKCFENIQTIGSKKYIVTKPNSEKIVSAYLKNTYKTNLTLNLFLARSSLLRQFPWNEKRKLGEHEEFFVTLFNNTINCAISHDIVFGELIDDRREYEYTFPTNSIHDLYSREYSLH